MRAKKMKASELLGIVRPVGGEALRQRLDDMGRAWIIDI